MFTISSINIAIIWIIILTTMGAILKRLWTTLFGSAVGLSIAGATLCNSHSIWFYLSASICLIIAICLLSKDIKIAKVEEAKNKIKEAKEDLEQDNRLSQIEKVSLIYPNDTKKHET